ncbi:hypothetical protein I4U23_013214 [Adineta vaga]|nr:hypothetical protein I4U23_013214 [Adineta vaga]
MYSGHRDAYYETMISTRETQHQSKSIYNNRQMMKTKQYIFWSSKFYDNYRTKDFLPVYRTPYTFQKTRIDHSSLLSFCVPDVYSPGSKGKCSLPPPCSNLPPPPSEWLH